MATSLSPRLTIAPPAVGFVSVRFIPHMAQNSRRAVVQAVGRQWAADRALNPVGAIDALSPQHGTGIEARREGVLVIDQCTDLVDAPYWLIARLTHPIEAGLPGGRPIDLVFTLISPANERIDHLRRLAHLLRQSHHEGLLTRLRGAESGEAMRLVLDDLFPDQVDILAA